MPILKLRNPVATSPILRKGGAHVKSKTSQRTRLKQDVKNAVTEWQIDKSNRR